MVNSKLFSFLMSFIGLGLIILTTLNLNSTGVSAQTLSSDSIESETIDEMVLGSDDAPVVLIEYASFTCPHCRTFHEDSFLKLKKNYIDSGQVKFIFREVYFDKYGLWAAMVARCSGSERYFGLVDLIFKKQDEWTTGDVDEVVGKLERIGKISGMSENQIQTCLQNNTKARALVEKYRENALEDSIKSTPSFIINGKLYSNMNYNELIEIIENNLN
ncbi:MAG: DsbA family protein [Paracoccaceae bacterium]